MLSSTLKVILRQLARHPIFTAINVVGLAVALACALLIGLFAHQELTYDQFHEAPETLYRVNWDYRWQNSEGIGSGTPPPLAARLLDDIPEVTEAVRVFPVHRMTVRHGETRFSETRLLGVDPSFFEVFSFELLTGDPAEVLAAPNRVVLTASTAQRYFGDASPVGQVVQIGEATTFLGRAYSEVFTVTGVVADPPLTSHIQFDLLTSIASHPEVAFFDWSWIWMQVTTYVRLRPEASAAVAEAKIPALVETYAPDAFERVGFSYDEMIASGGRWAFVLQPISEVYLNAETIGNRLGPGGNRTYVQVLLLVAVFVVIIACVNFMNLTTAQSARRTREIGVRKALGSGRGLLVRQFLAESVLVSSLALLLALVLVEVAAVPFSALIGSSLTLDPLRTPVWIGGVLGLTLGVGLLAGSYPAFYLSSFRAARVLKGTFRPSGHDGRLRQGLVVFQFTLTIALLACTFGVQRQMTYLGTTDLGFDREGVLLVSNERNKLGDQAETFRRALVQQAGVAEAALSTGAPPYFGFEDTYRLTGSGDEQVTLISYLADHHFTETLGIDLVEGRGFGPEAAAEARHVLINETTARLLDWEEPIGQTLMYDGDTYEVTGVMRDFNFLSLRSPIVPFALFHRASEQYQIADDYVVVRVQGADLPQTLREIETTWNAFVPDTPLTYTFLDDSFAQTYASEARLGRLFTVFSFLTILIACLGLLGLATFAAERRTKELGIRKVLGATVPELVALLSTDFARLVGVALVMATPIAYVVLQRWLGDFAFSASIGWGVFAAAGFLALTVALLTVSLQAFRAASANPVQSLQSE
ncbi:MAG: ABC transporter permease [Bacteroidota bacterium]